MEILLVGTYFTHTIVFCHGHQNYKNIISEASPHTISYIPDSGKLYDAVFVYNEVKQPMQCKTYKGNLFAAMGEPGESKYTHPFMFVELEQYDKVFSPINASKNTVLSCPYLPVSVAIPYQQLVKMSAPAKTKSISCIVSNQNYLLGHVLRKTFRDKYLQRSQVDIDYFGRGSQFIANKEDGLLDYRYSIAVENSSQDFYFTEKILDCFLCYTVPFYYGCTNIDSFFPKESYVWIDLQNPRKALHTIQQTLEEDDYQARLPYLQEARERVLKKYGIHSLIDALQSDILANKKNGKKTYTVQPVNFRRPLYYRVRNKLRKIMIRLTY